MLSTVVIAFLLGFSPTQQPSEEIVNQWNSLSQEEVQVLVQNFENEYKIKFSDVTDENIGTLEGLESVRAMRALDMRGN